MSAIASEITGVLSVCWTVWPGSDQRKHQNSASLAFASWMHRWPVDYPHEESVTQKMFPFDDVIMSQKFRMKPLSIAPENSMRSSQSPEDDPTKRNMLGRLCSQTLVWIHAFFRYHNGPILNSKFINTCLRFPTFFFFIIVTLFWNICTDIRNMQGVFWGNSVLHQFIAPILKRLHKRFENGLVI